MPAGARIVRYLTHPQVRVDPTVPVPNWSLSDVGRARVAQIAQHHRALAGTKHIFSSNENKALQTAQPLADALGLKVEVRPNLHENDRSATGFLPADEFERVADQFFANPDRSIRGWETAKDAQKRIHEAVTACLLNSNRGDILIVGHGGVGTLLYCALSDVQIDRRFDQGPGGGGNWFAFRLETMKPLHAWRPMEEMTAQ